MKHVKVNTFIHSFRKWVHINSGSTQFKHRDRSLSQHFETPRCVIWWNFDGGYVVLACIRYVYDFQNPNEAVIGCVLPSPTHRFKHERGFSYWPVSQCPLMAEEIRQQHLMWNDDRKHMWINHSYKQNKHCSMQMTNKLRLKRSGTKGYHEIYHHQTQGLQYNLKLCNGLHFFMYSQ